MSSRWGKTDMQATLDAYDTDASGSADFFKFKDGPNTVRLLPAAPGSRIPYQRRAQHWHVGPGDRVFNCPRAIDEDAACFLCAKKEQLKKSDDPADQEKANEIYAKRSFLYAILDPKNETKGVQVMSIGIKAHKQIAKLLADPEYGDITDLVEGLNIVIEKTGSGQTDTEYTVRPKRNPTDVSAIVEELDPPDLASICKPASNTEMKAAWNGEEAADAPKPAAEKSRRKDIDDDEPESPARRPAAAAADEDDEDEPEAPSAKRRPAADDDEEGPKVTRRRPAADEEPEPAPAAKGRRIATKKRDEDDD